MTHLVHRDHLLRIVMCLMQSIHWFNPICWLAVRLQQKDSEFYCDEKSFQHEDVVNRSDYAQALLQTSKIISGQPAVQRTGLITPAFAETGLKLRIQKVLLQKRTHWLIAAAAIIVILLAAILILPSWMSPAAELERLQTEYIRQFNFEVYANQGLYRSYTLRPEIMNELSIRCVWGLQNIDPKQYYGQQIDEYLFYAQTSDEDASSIEISKSSTNFYLLVADHKIIGGYRLSDGRYELSKPRSLTGMTLNELTGKNDLEWLETWQADYGTDWTEPWPEAVQNPIRLQSTKEKLSVDQYIASNVTFNLNSMYGDAFAVPFKITPFDYFQLGSYTVVGLKGNSSSQTSPNVCLGAYFLNKTTAGELSIVDGTIGGGKTNNGSEDITVRYAITYLNIPYLEHDMMAFILCDFPNIARIDLTDNDGSILCVQNYDGGPALMVYPLSDVRVDSIDGMTRLDHNIGSVTFYDAAGNVLRVGQ